MQGVSRGIPSMHPFCASLLRGVFLGNPIRGVCPGILRAHPLCRVRIHPVQGAAPCPLPAASRCSSGPGPAGSAPCRQSARSAAGRPWGVRVPRPPPRRGWSAPLRGPPGVVVAGRADSLSRRASRRRRGCGPLAAAVAPFRSASPGPPALLAAAMGSLLSRRIAGVEDIDIQANSAYRYPPKSGEGRGATPLSAGSGEGDGPSPGPVTPGRPEGDRRSRGRCRGGWAAGFPGEGVAGVPVTGRAEGGPGLLLALPTQLRGLPGAERRGTDLPGTNLWCEAALVRCLAEV